MQNGDLRMSQRNLEKNQSNTKRYTPERRAFLQKKREKNRKIITTGIYFGCSVLFFLLVQISGGSIWYGIHSFFLGIMGYCAFFVPLIFLAKAIETFFDQLNYQKLQVSSVLLLIFLFCTASFVFGKFESQNSYFQFLQELYVQSSLGKGPGVLSGILGIPLKSGLGDVGAKIVMILLLLLGFFFLFASCLYPFLQKPIQYFQEQEVEEELFIPPLQKSVEVKEKPISVKKDMPISKNRERGISQKSQPPEIMGIPGRKINIDIALDDSQKIEKQKESFQDVATSSPYKVKVEEKIPVVPKVPFSSNIRKIPEFHVHLYTKSEVVREIRKDSAEEPTSISLEENVPTVDDLQVKLQNILSKETTPIKENVQEKCQEEKMPNSVETTEDIWDLLSKTAESGKAQTAPVIRISPQGELLSFSLVKRAGKKKNNIELEKNIELENDNNNHEDQKQDLNETKIGLETGEIGTIDSPTLLVEQEERVSGDSIEKEQEIFSPEDGENGTLETVGTDLSINEEKEKEGEEEEALKQELSSESDGQDHILINQKKIEKIFSEDFLKVEKKEHNKKKRDLEYIPPSLELLSFSQKIDDNKIEEELKVNGEKLIDTLKSFGVQARLVDVSRGPAVTRYELQPAPGIKISKITNLSDDIAMNLAASGVRIEAPIPGKAAVGIEVPNKNISVVRMRELIGSEQFHCATSSLTVALGLNITGEIVLADLAKMPHLLIAGSTGSGKSVCINSLIVSLLYKSSPKDVKFLMIDPKVVELGIYNGIPHLLIPVVTDPRKAAGALGWAVSEMLNRYKLFAENNVRDLSGYNQLVAGRGYVDQDGQPAPALPQIVIIIDELADLMMAAPNEVEDAICRLAQMARAAGMHLVIATQRPSVDVITGIIKANIPSRIAFAVSSQIDSRTILDTGGAEKLLGRGDMLFSPVGVQKPVRVQGCFVSDQEIEHVVEAVKENESMGYDQSVLDEIERNATAKEKDSETEESIAQDSMLPEAIKCVVEAGQASTSLLQRKLRLGYARAGRLIDQMEQMGIVGPHEGSKPRQVLITYQQYLEYQMREDSLEESSE